ncbi:TonB-dependent receptor [Sphingomonas sp. A2-49]|uniref:TonB-dependent receptor n=1 Tax=Sphingomonas sp. A2-49 TaxID=1391375 RepID=UPI0021CFBA69|nr:TonB-dependent receptor [Sphingomonas sp. A2-49]MCU6456109.1 TonB-dependent receptor [Sphingomonas sp. A2-49]
MTMNFAGRSLLLSGAAILAIAATAPARAQVAPATNSTTDPAEVVAADPTAGGDSRLGDIVVTATKRETNLQKTPIAISVLDSTAITDRHVQSLLDLADGGVPSLRVATFEARQSALTIGIRGIVPFDQNQTARDSGVGVYVDGVYLGRSQGLNAALFDVARIEVLKGPQGTLFGRNTEGGALSVVTKPPSGRFEGRMSAGVGNYGQHNAEMHLDLPSYRDISVKLDGVYQHQGPTVKDPLAGSVGWNAYDRVGGRIAARWKPTDAFTADVAFDKAKDQNTPFFSQLINFNPLGYTVVSTADQAARVAAGQSALPASNGTTRYISALPALVGVHPDRQDRADIGVPQQYSVDQTQGVSANLRYAVAPALELRSITAWRRVSTDQWDNSGGPARTPFTPNGKFSRYSLSDLHQSQFSQEFQAVGSVSQIDYVAGLYYFQEQARETAATPSSNQWNATGTAYTILPSQVFGTITSGNQGWDYNSRFLQRGSVARAHSYAAYGQATYTPDWAPALHLTGGGRYTKDKRNGTLYLVSGVATNYRLAYDRGRFDPMVTLAYDAAPGVNLYAKYSSGFRAGGANARSSNFGAFGPESVKAYELGAKTDFLDHRIRLNLAGYVMDRRNTQIDFDNVDINQFVPGTTIPNPNFNLHTENTANAPGTSRIRGLEADVTARPFDALTLGASYAYTYTRIPATANPNPGPTFGVLTQVYTVYTPPHAASAYADYEVPVGGGDARVRLHLDANYADAQYSFQNEAVKTDSSFIVNGRLALADVDLGGANRVTFSLWTRNLLDEQHIYRRSNANNATLGAYANFNPPRTFGGDVAVKF